MYRQCVDLMYVLIHLCKRHWPFQGISEEGHPPWARTRGLEGAALVMASSPLLSQVPCHVISFVDYSWLLSTLSPASVRASLKGWVFLLCSFHISNNLHNDTLPTFQCLPVLLPVMARWDQSRTPPPTFHIPHVASTLLLDSCQAGTSAPEFWSSFAWLFH